MKYLIIFLVLVGVSGFAYALDEKSSNTSPKSLEEYEIEIGGLNDKYEVGENYYFYFIISGYGYSCASYDVSYPDKNGEIIHMSADPLCNPNQSKQKFEINSLHHPIDLANVGITKPGNYTVTVTFDKPSKDFPTTAIKEFQVVKTMNGSFHKLSPLKQFKSGIPIDKIQCKENLVLMQNRNGSPACVTFQTGDILVKRGWATCDDGISHGRSHPCGPRSSGIVNFDRDSYKLVNSLDCPISILNQTGNEPIMRPPPMEIQILGKAVRTIEEAKSYSGINDATMPNYIPSCLELRQIFARNAQDGNKEITLLYTLNDTDYSSIKYIDDALQRGLAISFTYEKDSSLGWEGYVDGIVAGNPSKRFDVGDAIFLVTSRNPFQLSATHADTIIDNVRITLTSYIMDADEIKKIAKSMFEN